ncbi:MAG: glycosyltransferase family 2 protein [Candidatus Omnitrophota bacterium]
MANTTQADVVYLQPPIKAVSVIIPCKNEEESVGPTVKNVEAVLSPLDIDYEIIVVDDGSTDKTREKALFAGAKVLVHSINMGYGNSIMDGMKIARYPVIAIMDADGTYPISMLPSMIEKASQHDMVIGSRVWTRDNTSILGKFLRKSLYYLILYFSNVKAPDYNSGFRVFYKLNTLDYRSILCPTFSFTTSLTVLYLVMMRSVYFMDIEYSKRIGISKVSYLRDTISTFSYVFILTSLFQPYRLSIMVIILGFILNLMTMFFSFLLNLNQSLQIGLYFMISLIIIVVTMAINTYPTAKEYLNQLHEGQRNAS